MKVSLIFSVWRDTFAEAVKYISAFVAVLIIGAGLVAFQGENPGNAMGAIFVGAFGDMFAIGNTIRWIIPCILAGMAAMVAFKSGVFNLGIEGQLFAGGFAAAIVGHYVSLPPVLHAIVCLLAGGAAGLLFALMPAILKLFFRINEMIVTLMLNYIAILLTEYLTFLVMGASPAFDTLALQTPPIQDTARLPVIITGTFANAGIFIGIAVVLIVFMVYRYTTKGYELKQVGENIRFSKVGGVNVKRTFIMIFLISGFIAGLCGSVEALGAHGRFVSRFSNNLGWDGIMVSLIARNSPFGVLVVSALWGILRAGALHMERVTNINRLTVVLIQALFVLFVTVNYSRVFAFFTKHLRSKTVKEGGASKDA